MRTILVMLVLASMFVTGCQTAESQWNYAVGRNTIQGYRQYEQQYPDSEYAALARQRRDDLQYAKIGKSYGQARDLLAYLGKFPQGRNGKAALGRLSGLLKKEDSLSTLTDLLERCSPSSAAEKLVFSRLLAAIDKQTSIGLLRLVLKDAKAERVRMPLRTRLAKLIATTKDTEDLFELSTEKAGTPLAAAADARIGKLLAAWAGSGKSADLKRLCQLANAAANAKSPLAAPALAAVVKQLAAKAKPIAQAEYLQAIPAKYRKYVLRRGATVMQWQKSGGKTSFSVFAVGGNIHGSVTLDGSYNRDVYRVVGVTIERYKSKQYYHVNSKRYVWP